MRYIQKSGITNKSVSGDRGAYGFLSVLSRRAHLLTTDCIAKQCVSAGVTACGSRALYEVLFRYFAPKRQICFGGLTPPFSPCGEKQPILHSYNRYTRKEVIAYRHISS